MRDGKSPAVDCCRCARSEPRKSRRIPHLMPAAATIAGIYRAGRSPWRCQLLHHRLREDRQQRVVRPLNNQTKPAAPAAPGSGRTDVACRLQRLRSQATICASSRRTTYRIPIAVLPSEVFRAQLQQLRSQPVAGAGRNHAQPQIGIALPAATASPYPRPTTAAPATACLYGSSAAPATLQGRFATWPTLPLQPHRNSNRKSGDPFPELARRKPASLPPAQGCAGGGLFLCRHDMPTPAGIAPPAFPGSRRPAAGETCRTRHSRTGRARSAAGARKAPAAASRGISP